MAKVTRSRAVKLRKTKASGSEDNAPEEIPKVKKQEIKAQSQDDSGVEIQKEPEPKRSSRKRKEVDSKAVTKNASKRSKKRESSISHTEKKNNTIANNDSHSPKEEPIEGQGSEEIATEPSTKSTAKPDIRRFRRKCSTKMNFKEDPSDDDAAVSNSDDVKPSAPKRSKKKTNTKKIIVKDEDFSSEDSLDYLLDSSKKSKKKTKSETSSKKKLSKNEPKKLFTKIRRKPVEFQKDDDCLILRQIISKEKETKMPKIEEKKENDQKSIIMSALREHEAVEEMSDSDDSEDVETKPPTEIEVPTVSGTSEKNAKALKRKRVPKSKKLVEPEKGDQDDDDEDDEDDEDDWEVVDQGRDPNYKRPDNNVTVVLRNEDFLPDAKRLSVQQLMIRVINSRRKIRQSLEHRVHLLCLLAHERHLNSILHEDDLKALALSRLPFTIISAKPSIDSQLIKEILLFYKTAFSVNPKDEDFSPGSLKHNLEQFFSDKATHCNIVYLLGLLLVLRGVGIRSRLCLSFHPIPVRPRLLRIKDGDVVELKSQSVLSQTTPGIVDMFIEVYLSDKNAWRPVDMEEFRLFDNSHQLTPHLEQPVAYLISIEGETGVMKDLSPKYNSDWLNITKKLRPNAAEAEFFDTFLSRFAPEEGAADFVEEQKEIQDCHEQHGLPKVISEYKNHPKYALRRHLLKFEALYPPNPPVLGYVRNEPVYPRECVKLLRSRDTWPKHGRQVKDNEEPYNTVKARPKWNRKADCFIKDLPLAVFGEWQTEKYKPPVAKDGKVPRNTFGNVELFHPDMLPIGTVHLKLPGIHRLALELGIDCVPAIVGFDGVARGLHPVTEGYVVCSEFQEVLENAWEDWNREERKKRNEKARKRAVKNWKKLFKRVIWDIRVKKKYKHKLE